MPDQPATFAATMASLSADVLITTVTAAIAVGTNEANIAGNCLRELARRFDKRSFMNICEMIIQSAADRGFVLEGAL